jgi:hypothetical protein
LKCSKTLPSLSSGIKTLFKFLILTRHSSFLFSLVTPPIPFLTKSFWSLINWLPSYTIHHSDFTSILYPWTLFTHFPIWSIWSSKVLIPSYYRHLPILAFLNLFHVGLNWGSLFVYHSCIDHSLFVRTRSFCYSYYFISACCSYH